MKGRLLEELTIKEDEQESPDREEPTVRGGVSKRVGPVLRTKGGKWQNLELEGK